MKLDLNGSNVWNYPHPLPLLRTTLPSLRHALGAGRCSSSHVSTSDGLSSLRRPSPLFILPRRSGEQKGAKAEHLGVGVGVLTRWPWRSTRRSRPWRRRSSRSPEATRTRPPCRLVPMRRSPGHHLPSRSHPTASSAGRGLSTKSSAAAEVTTKEAPFFSSWSVKPLCSWNFWVDFCFLSGRRSNFYWLLRLKPCTLDLTWFFNPCFTSFEPG